MKIRVLALGAVLASAQAAFAVEPGHGYAGVLISKFGYDSTIGVSGDDYDFEADPEAFIARIGYQLSNVVSIEARYGAGTSDGSLKADDRDTNADLGIDSYYGAFIRAGFPNATNVQPYFIAGYNKIKIEIQNSSISTNDDDDDLVMGFGADAAFGNLVISLEYLQVYDKNNVGADALSLGAALAF